MIDPYPSDCDCGEPEEKELIHARYDDGPNYADDPDTEGHGRYAGVISIRNGRPNLGVR